MASVTHAIRGKHQGRERSLINLVDTFGLMALILTLLTDASTLLLSNRFREDASCVYYYYYYYYSDACDPPIGSLLVIATAKMALGE